MDTVEQAEFRIKTTLRVCHLFRMALERNGNQYSGGLVPNLTSITDCLTIPFDMLKDQVDKTPELRAPMSAQTGGEI